jgi:hypothetical protein
MLHLRFKLLIFVAGSAMPVDHRMLACCLPGASALNHAA